MRYEEMNLPEPLRRAVERMGFDEMTQVQELAIPPMCEGFDLIAKAPTGTGKTCAFGIPLLMGLDTEKTQPQAVVLAPTRELAQQIAAELRELAHFMPAVRIACLYGGGDMRRQTERLKKGVQLVVATPGRLMDHIKRGNLRTDAVTDVVLDEADEMLNMGFYKDVVKILDTLKARRQRNHRAGRGAVCPADYAIPHFDHRAKQAARCDGDFVAKGAAARDDFLQHEIHQ